MYLQTTGFWIAFLCDESFIFCNHLVFVYSQPF